MKKKRPPRELPLERLVSTEELAGILGEHPITAYNKSNPEHKSYDPDHPQPVKGPKGSPSRWWLPDAYEYVEIRKQRSEKRGAA
jgi:hypothetical protein